MTIYKVDYCDFIVWTPDLYNEQRLKRDGRSCDQMFATAREFFLREILPEFSSKLFTPVGDFPALSTNAAPRLAEPPATKESAPLAQPTTSAHEASASSSEQEELVLPGLDSDSESSFFDLPSTLSPFGPADGGRDVQEESPATTSTSEESSAEVSTPSEDRRRDGPPSASTRWTRPNARQGFQTRHAPLERHEQDSRYAHGPSPDNNHRPLLETTQPRPHNSRRRHRGC
ncbi:hypothetical protein HPB48_017953 [Haemaphysalis longicornis]|uniref:Uncharacterized protein n=1 Tax=Haemaphysalis longicornis TaxID=44386 RepID=A0A9J6GL56_HAELO|nr:hypothetical protein HPB48_017953 [Haemaphysalis longicornis]